MSIQDTSLHDASPQDGPIQDTPAETRRPGRPPQTDEEAQRARENILDATSRVFADHGYHGINVAKIIDAAGIARPTFYRYFKNTDEALTVVLHDVGRSLARHIMRALHTADAAIPKALAAIDAYLNWSFEHSHLLQSLYAGMHDPTSLLYGLRPLLVDQIVLVFGDQFELVHRPRPDAATLDAMLNAVEFACFRLHAGGAHDEDAIQATRLNMSRMALALMGSADDWRFVVEHPRMLEAFTGGR